MYVHPSNKPLADSSEATFTPSQSSSIAPWLAELDAVYLVRGMRRAAEDESSD